MQSRNKKKLTKKEAIQILVDTYETTLHNNFIKNMVIGFETASNMYLSKIENGCTIEELKDFIKLNIEKENDITDILLNRKENKNE